jgi:hypothetical protein
MKSGGSHPQTQHTDTSGKPFTQEDLELALKKSRLEVPS